jgi:hypothetical protein
MKVGNIKLCTPVLKSAVFCVELRVVREEPDVSEEHITSIFRIEDYVSKKNISRSRRQGSFLIFYSSIPNMEAVFSSGILGSL